MVAKMSANEDVSGKKSNSDYNLLFQSKDAQTMVAVLKEMGVEEFEPRVIYQLLEFSYRYTTNLLEDAKAFSTHANKKNIDSEDIKMAIRSKVDFSFTTTPPRDLLLEISKTKNKSALPSIKYHSGIRLPPDRFCLHAPNYTVKTQTHYSNQQPPMFHQEQISASNKQPQMPTNQNMPLGFATKRPRNDEDDYDM